MMTTVGSVLIMNVTMVLVNLTVLVIHSAQMMKESKRR
jgi:hypothetical protein